MAVDDFIMTLDSGDEEEEVGEIPVPTKKSVTGKEVDDSLNPDFTFDLSGDPYVDVVESGDIVKTGSKPVSSFQPFRRVSDAQCVLGSHFSG
jgi:ATP-dependent RNA helicase DDX27